MKSTRIGSSTVVQSGTVGGIGCVSIMSTNKDKPACLVLPLPNVDALIDALMEHRDALWRQSIGNKKTGTAIIDVPKGHD